MDASTLEIDEKGAFWKKLQPYIAEALQKLQLKAKKGNVIVAENDPMRFLGALFAGILNGEAVFLANADWSYDTWEHFKRIVKGGYLFSKAGSEPYGIEIQENRHLGHIMIPTGGSTGGVKLVIHDWENLKGSAKGTQTFLGGGAINSACLLPLYHVSGLMQAVRAVISGGDIAFIDNKSIKHPNDLPRLGEGYVTSLVPTQMGRLLQNKTGEQWLKQFDCIFLGGAKTDETLLEQARAAQLKISICYGATETASMATAMNPETFLKGGNGVGEPLGDFGIRILNTKPLEAGKIKITGPVYKGYYPSLEPRNKIFDTHDRGMINEEGSIIILGRDDNIINTGGEKVDAEEVADAIRALNAIKDVFVFGIQDQEWGEKVVSLVVCDERICNSDTLTTLLKEKLERYKIPKEWVCVERIPLNDAGKVDRVMARRIVLENRTEQSGSLINLENAIAARHSQLKAMLKALLNGKSEITLEIGCGHGDYLTAYGQANPKEFCVGVDILAKRLRKADNKRQKRGLNNVLFVKTEGNELLEALPEETKLGKIFVLFPDPWPKRRHEKNRLIQANFLESIATYSAEGTQLFIRTDHDGYYEWAKEQIASSQHWREDTDATWPFEQETFFQKLADKHRSVIARRRPASIINK